MVKRVNLRFYYYLAFALILLLVSWENSRTHAAVIASEIPEQSIRLRILANSDNVQDQALKRRLRDAITAQMAQWVTGPATLEEAREIVGARLPELHELVGQELAASGYDYTYKVELGIVPFPAKMYGNKLYPAGDYEALRLTIGSGLGQNWWCVLFPPLCFVDAASGEAVTKEEKKEKKAVSAFKDEDKDGKEEKGSAKEKAGKSVKTASGKASGKQDEGENEGLKVKSKKQVRFFFWDKVKSWFA